MIYPRTTGGSKSIPSRIKGSSSSLKSLETIQSHHHSASCSADLMEEAEAALSVDTDSFKVLSSNSSTGLVYVLLLIYFL